MPKEVKDLLVVYMYSSDGGLFHFVHCLRGSFCDVNLYPQNGSTKADWKIIYKALLYISK